VNVVVAARNEMVAPPADYLAQIALEIASRAGRLYEAAGDLADALDYLSRRTPEHMLDGVLREMAERVQNEDLTLFSDTELPAAPAERVLKALAGLMESQDALQDYCVRLGLLDHVYERMPATNTNTMTPLDELERSAPRLAQRLKGLMREMRLHEGA